MRVTVEDDGYEDNDIFVPGPDGGYEPDGKELMPSWMMCDIDRDEVMYVTDEQSHKVGVSPRQANSWAFGVRPGMGRAN